MESLTPARLAQLRKIMAELGHEVDDESLYDVAVAVVRFVAGVEFSKTSHNQ